MVSLCYTVTNFLRNLADEQQHLSVNEAWTNSIRQGDIHVVEYHVATLETLAPCPLLQFLFRTYSTSCLGTESGPCGMVRM
jgi:predicted short-subunit dehydrogenase-like oxidoreductase (DUF2520 family)